MNKNPNFAISLSEIMDIDVEEVIGHVNRLQLEEILKRPRFKLNNELYYIKNSYDYFKATPIHYLSDNPEFTQLGYNERIAAYHVLKGIGSGCSLHDALSDFRGHESGIIEFLFKNDLIESHGRDYDLTKNGTEYLNSMGWIEDYRTVLDRFDFNEFEEHLNGKDHEFMDAALEFLDKHALLAEERKDLKAQFDAQSSKALLWVLNAKFQKALDEEAKLFMTRLNPVCRSPGELVFHEAINQVNVHNLNSLMIICGTEDVEMLFDRNWESLDLKSPLIGKTDSFDFFRDALRGDDLDRLNRSAETHYF